MKLNIKKVIVVLIIIAIAISVVFIISNNKNEIDIEEENEKNISTEEIEEIKEETGMTAKNELYEIQTEYDGKKVLNIKPEIQYKIAFAGIIKEKIPEIKEIDDIFKKEYPSDTGIWVNANNRNEFLKLLDKNTNNEYEITKQGYLKIKQEKEPNIEDKALKKMIEGREQYIVTISGTYYEADRVSGEILDNFFEEMDPYQASKLIKWDNNIITILSTNKRKKLSEEEILQELTAYGK